jgi:hypothetical protein
MRDATDIQAADTGALSAEQVDALIRRLADQRAAMAPVHPAVPPLDPAASHQADNMLWHVRPAPYAAALELSMYHPGLGWISMLMSRAQIEDLQDAIVYALRGMPEIANSAAPARPRR